MTTSNEAKAMITNHAIIRYMERIEGYDFQEIRDDLEKRGIEITDINILREIYSRYGLTRGHINYKIVTKGVKLAIKSGACKIKRGDWELVVKEGVIVTVQPRGTVQIRQERKNRLKGKRPGRFKFHDQYMWHHGEKRRMDVKLKK